jgi:putative MATE family efflux protein
MSFFIREKNFYKRFFYLTLIIALQNIITFGVNLTDNIMLGGYSEAALSGVAIVNQIQFILQMIIMGICEGLVIMSSRYWGTKDIGSIKKVTSIVMRITIVFSIILWFIVFLFPRSCLSLFTNDTATISEGVKYLQIICFTYTFFAITSTLIAAMRSVETVKIGFIISLSTLTINICLNYILIYGNFNAPRLGIRGSAIATLTARIIELIIVCIFIKRFEKKIFYKLKDFLKIDMHLFSQYIKIGFPIILSNAVWAFAMATQTAILGHLKESAIAANSIATTIFQIVSVLTYASSTATSIIIGKTIGEGNIDKIKPYAKRLQILYLIIGVSTGITLFFFKDFIINIYNITPQARALALQFMTILSVTVCGTAYQMPCLTGIVRSGGDTRFVLYNDLIFMWLIVLPSSAICAFVFNFSPVAVFICLKSDQILKCFVAIVKVNQYKWIRNFSA